MKLIDDINLQMSSTKDQLDKVLAEIEVAQKDVDLARKQLESQSNEAGACKELLSAMSPTEQALLAACGISGCTDDDIRNSREQLKKCQAKLSNCQTEANPLRERLATFEGIAKKINRIVNKEAEPDGSA